MRYQTKDNDKKYFCMYCLQCFSSADVLNKHIYKENYIVGNGQRSIKTPKEDEQVFSTEKVDRQMPVPFVIYANFKAVIKSIRTIVVLISWFVITMMGTAKIPNI